MWIRVEQKSIGEEGRRPDEKVGEERRAQENGGKHRRAKENKHRRV